MPGEVGFGSLLGEKGFFAHLFGRSPSGSGRKLLYEDDLPVVLLNGGPGMGKTRLLHAVRDHFATEVPVIYLDCRKEMYAARARTEPDARSAATEALFEVAGRLRTWKGTGGSFTFPRLFPGLAVLATGVRQGTAEAVATEVERYEQIAQRRRAFGLRAGDFWSGVIQGGIRNLLMAWAGVALGPYPAAVLNAVADELIKRSAHRGRAELERIYGAYPGAAGQPKHGLMNLAADFHAGGEARRPAEDFLFRVLREDLEADYASASGYMRRVGRPGLLLDHADAPLGQGLLRAVLADRRDGQRDRTVVVGTARRADGGEFLHAGLPPDEVEPPAAFRPTDGYPATWTRRTTGAPGGANQAVLADGVLQLRMPYLSGVQIGEETARLRSLGAPTGGANALRLDSAVARLSSGRLHSVMRLAAAAKSFQMPPDANDRDLLAAPLRESGAAERPVADVLLEELIERELPTKLPAQHEDHWLDLLTHLSIAHDPECADVLLRHYQQGHMDPLTAAQVSRLLLDTGWPRCERHFIGDFGLRQLLLHRLYGLLPDGAAWNADHQLLRDHYPPEPSAAADLAASLPDEAPPAFRSPTAHHLNHHLVSGGVPDVVRHLVRRLPGRPEAWCAELLEIAQAPYLLGADARRQRALGRVSMEGEPLDVTVDRLLHAVWLCEERTRPTGEEMAGALTTLLNLLATMGFDGAGRLVAATADWPGLVANQQPLLRCTCTHQMGRRR
ncbi:hypothetical protein [Streptomyces sp. B22F1]|uniref:hypothetical protein n=1 Tax=Streptomyces sp. B22F1 TaxID=3153566 RepID=UPI00325E2F82